MAESKKGTTTQLSLAWLLHKSLMMLPIPGTYSLEHLRENVESAQIELSQEEMVVLETMGAQRLPKIGTESLFRNRLDLFALRAPTASSPPV
jgi:aryl-alcohol dehydrogenase-like predicted oxidoreductase